MSAAIAHRKRTILYLSIAGLLLMVGAVSAISTQDPSGASLRIVMVMITVGAAMWLPWQQLIPAVLLAWLAPNFGRSLVQDYRLFEASMMLELPGLLALGGFGYVARESLRLLEKETMLIGAQNVADGINPVTGVFHARQLRGAIEAEIARSRRFGRTFALVLVGIDEMRQRFDYRDAEQWSASLSATARLLRNTRHNVDRVFHHGDDSFALLLPESTEKDVAGMVRRLRRLARRASPAEGKPGGPLPAHYGATFFPSCATTPDDLLRRAEIAMRIAERNSLRYQLDSAEAPELPPGETLRRSQDEITAELNRGAKTPGPVSHEMTQTEKPESASAIEESPTLEGFEPKEPAAVVVPEAATAPLIAISAAPLPETPEEVPLHPVEARADEEKDTAALLDDPVENIDRLVGRMNATLSMIRSARSR